MEVECLLHSTFLLIFLNNNVWIYMHNFSEISTEMLLYIFIAFSKQCYYIFLYEFIHSINASSQYFIHCKKSECSSIFVRNVVLYIWYHQKCMAYTLVCKNLMKFMHVILFINQTSTKLLLISNFFYLNIF